MTVSISPPKAARSGLNVQTIIHNFGPVLILLVLMTIAASMSDEFISERNLLNVLRQVSGTGLMSVGMLFVILTRGIDLSVGSVAALGSVTASLLIQRFAPMPTIGMTMLVGMSVGAVSGF